MSGRTSRADAGAADRAELIGHLVRTSRLSPPEAAKVVDEVVAYYGESTEEFVRRRHRQLQAAGLTNPEIFRRIAADLGNRRVAPPRLSDRQLRRIVYG